MKTISNKVFRSASVALIAFSSLGFAQEQRTANSGGWRKFGDAQTDQRAQIDPAYSEQRNDIPEAAPQGAPAQDPQGNQNYAPQQNMPLQLTLRPGTFITVRMNQMLSSDRNQPGDAFTAVLDRPLVIDGVIVAYRGQTIAGRVAEAKKAGRVEGVSRLGVELTELTLVDGQQLPLRTQMLAHTGGTSVGRDVGAVAATTATGAAIGAAADWGRGAAIGAGAGAVAGLAGVLLTRGHPTEIYPEALMTFRVEAPVTVSTAQAPQAFHYATSEDYGRQDGSRPPPSFSQRSNVPPPAPYAPYYNGPAYDPYYYYGPSVGFYVGPGYGYYGHGYYGHGYYGRGYYRGGYRR